MYVLSVCLLQKRARSLELAPDQIRNQLVFNNPEQQLSFGRGTPSGDPSFFNNYYNNDNTFYRDQQQLSSFIGSSTNLDNQFVPGQQIRATTYKPTFDTHRLQQQNQLQHQQNQLYQQRQQQQQQQQQQQTHNPFSFQTPTQQRGVSSPIEIVPSVSLSDSFLGPPLPPQVTYNNAFQQPQDPRYYNNLQTQQPNAFQQPSASHFNNQAINFQHQQQQPQQQNRRNSVADSRVYPNQVSNYNNNGRPFSRVGFHGPSGGQTFVQYK
jgi:hypothetical protein